MLKRPSAHCETSKARIEGRLLVLVELIMNLLCVYRHLTVKSAPEVKVTVDFAQNAYLSQLFSSASLTDINIITVKIKREAAWTL